jgi:hypothetical protein
MSVGATPGGGNAILDTFRQGATAAKDWVAGSKVGRAVSEKFNAAVNDVNTTDSKALKIAKAVGYALAAVALGGFLLAVSAPIAYFCSPALFGVFAGVLATGITLAIGMGVKAAVFAVAAHNHGKIEDLKSQGTPNPDGTTSSASTDKSGNVQQDISVDAATAPGSTATAQQPDATDTGLGTEIATNPNDQTDTAEKTTRSSLPSKIGNFFKKHWKAILTGVLTVAVFAMCIASGGIGFGFTLLLTTLAGSYGILKGAGAVAEKACAAKETLCNWLEDRKDVSGRVNAELASYENTPEVATAQPQERKAMMEEKREELEKTVRRDVAEARAIKNSINEVESLSGMDKTEVEDRVNAQKNRNASLQANIDGINDDQGLNISRADIDKQCGGSYQSRLHEALPKNGGDLEKAKAQLDEADTKALNDLQAQGLAQRDARMAQFKKDHDLEGINDFFVRPFLIEESRLRRMGEQTGHVPSLEDIKECFMAVKEKVIQKFGRRTS